LFALADLPGVTLAHEDEITIDVENPSTRISGQQSQPAPPTPADTEIFLASLLVNGDKLAVGAPVNITNSPGYDNQPSFTPDGNRILFVSVRGSSAAPRDRNGPAEPRTPATDIFRYDIASRGISRITNTPEGEFSPAVMPDGESISVVRVESDGTQRLWRIAAENTRDASIILRDIKPVGYYAWVDERTLALYVLGLADKPSTLQVAEPQTGKSQVVATGIGRSIQRMPSGHVSFVARRPDAASTSPVLYHLFKTADPAGFGTEPLTSVPPGISEPYVVWLPDGSALLAGDTTLYRWRRGETSWTAVANLAAFGLRGVTRLAISPKGDRLAIVAPAK
jgi:dipeptidyl aminopeptidase/acylaminoacyl peptidase